MTLCAGYAASVLLSRIQMGSSQSAEAVREAAMTAGGQCLPGRNG